MSDLNKDQLNEEKLQKILDYQKELSQKQNGNDNNKKNLNENKQSENLDKMNDIKEKLEQVQIDKDQKIQQDNQNNTNKDQEENIQPQQQDQNNNDINTEEQKENQQENQDNQNEIKEAINSLPDPVPQIEKNMEESLKLKQKATDHFKNQQWQIAIDYYEDAIDYAPEDDKRHLSILYSNIGVCNNKLNQYEETIKHCSQSIEFDPEYRKPYLNRAIAFENSDREEEALEDLQKVLKMNPDDKQLQIQIFRLEKKVKEVQEKRKTEVMSGLKDLGNTILGKFGMSLDNFKLQKGDNGGYNINFKQ